MKVVGKAAQQKIEQTHVCFHCQLVIEVSEALRFLTDNVLINSLRISYNIF